MLFIFHLRTSNEATGTDINTSMLDIIYEMFVVGNHKFGRPLKKPASDFTLQFDPFIAPLNMGEKKPMDPEWSGPLWRKWGWKLKEYLKILEDFQRVTAAQL